MINLYEKVIDSHIHFDQYTQNEREKVINDLKMYRVEALITVATDLNSAKHILKLSNQYDVVKPALGYHPEQKLPKRDEVDKLIQLIVENKEKIFAIGEVGLPYYLRNDLHISCNEKYVDLLNIFIKLAKRLNKPIVLHAIYEDAKTVCQLLENESIEQAHFHWFKGDDATIERMIQNGYHISVTPDVLYEKESIDLVKKYPLDLMMVETDGPWPFEGIFKDEMTHPKMVHEVIRKIAELKRRSYRETAKIIYRSTVNFYNLSK